MPPFAEIRHYFEGAWRLAKGDTGGMAHFDFSADGFWRSFWAIVVVAPGYAILVADQYIRRGEPVAFWPTFTAETLSYLLGWAAFPILAIWLTRMFGVAERYVPLIVALNWSSMVQIAALVVPIALGAMLSAAMVDVPLDDPHGCRAVLPRLHHQDRARLHGGHRRHLPRGRPRRRHAGQRPDLQPGRRITSVK
jgi:hypothetical protein